MAMAANPQQLSEARSGVRAPQRMLVAFATVFAAVVVSMIVSGNGVGNVFATWMYAGFTLFLLLSAGMLGMLLTTKMAKKGLFDGSPLPRVFRLVVAFALGLGAISLATLGLGFVHFIGVGGGWVAVVLQIVAALAGWGATKQFFSQARISDLTARASEQWWMLLAAAVPVGVMAVAATFPPGTLWKSEGRGYDVIEYHLEMPREYGETNSVMPVENNVYSYLPANVEMLYLLEIQTAKAAFSSDSALWGVYPSQFLHMAFMLLTAIAVGVVPIRMGVLGRAAAIILVLAIPWTIVTGSLAYDEGGMMLWGSLGLGLALGTREKSGKQTLAYVVIGALLGLAVGSKLTAGLFFAVPAAVALISRREWVGGLKGALIVSVVAIAFFSPWAIRAAIASGGNPVFPLAARTLPRDHWSVEQIEKFEKGHAALAEQAGVKAHFDALVHEWFQHDQWSTSRSTLFEWQRALEGKVILAEGNINAVSKIGVLWIIFAMGAVVALTTAFGGTTLLLIVSLGIQVAAWLALTHLQSRFLMPTMVPLAWLVGTGMGSPRRGWVVPLKAVMGLGIVIQAGAAVFFLLPEVGLFKRTEVPSKEGKIYSENQPIGQLFERQVNVAAEIEGENSPAAAREKVLLVGLATPLFWQGDIVYSTVFDREQLAEHLRVGGPSGAVKWLRDEKIQYVVVSWPEVERLRKTYGFDPAITPESITAMKNQGLREVPVTPEMTVLKVD